MMVCKKMAEWLEHGENSRLEDDLLEHAEDLSSVRFGLERQVSVGPSIG